MVNQDSNSKVILALAAVLCAGTAGACLHAGGGSSTTPVAHGLPAGQRLQGKAR